MCGTQTASGAGRGATGLESQHTTNAIGACGGQLGSAVAAVIGLSQQHLLLWEMVAVSESGVGGCLVLRMASGVAQQLFVGAGSVTEAQQLLRLVLSSGLEQQHPRLSFSIGLQAQFEIVLPSEWY
jgi:hypothetical protein